MTQCLLVWYRSVQRFELPWRDRRTDWCKSFFGKICLQRAFLTQSFVTHCTWSLRCIFCFFSFRTHEHVDSEMEMSVVSVCASGENLSHQLTAGASRARHQCAVYVYLLSDPRAHNYAQYWNHLNHTTFGSPEGADPNVWKWSTLLACTHLLCRLGTAPTLSDSI